jgi:hypothetical protein
MSWSALTQSLLWLLAEVEPKANELMNTVIWYNEATECHYLLCFYTTTQTRGTYLQLTWPTIGNCNGMTQLSNHIHKAIHQDKAHFSKHNGSWTCSVLPGKAVTCYRTRGRAVDLFFGNSWVAKLFFCKQKKSFVLSGSLMLVFFFPNSGTLN